MYFSAPAVHQYGAATDSDHVMKKPYSAKCGQWGSRDRVSDGISAGMESGGRQGGVDLG